MTTSPETSEPTRRADVTEDAGHPTLSDALRHWARTQGDRCAVTFVDYRVRDAGMATSMTWRTLDARVDAVAAWCQRRAVRGDRVAVLVDQSLDYVVAFLGALRAGLVAVPLFEPTPLPGHDERLAAVLTDCAPSLVLTARRHGDAIERFLTRRGLSGPRIVAVDVVPLVSGHDYDPVPLRPDDIAYLQYTSGSTRAPAGVMITHANVVANARQGMASYGCEQALTTSVSWLPLFHDMGLVLGLVSPVHGGFPATLMDPLAFLARPRRWLERLAATRGPVVTAAPNFAYGYTASRTTEAERAALRLDHVVALGDGSEPVLPSTLDTFYEAFADCGLHPRMHRHTYGLAEAVVLVSVSSAGSPPARVSLDRTALAAGRAEVVAPGVGSALTLVSAGQAVGQEIRIVDPKTATTVPSGHVGEIWVSGPNVGVGYWGREEDTRHVFAAQLRDAEGGIVEPWPERPGWLRTGDLGVLVDGDLYITGRQKDLIIVDGHNHYPQDLEYTVEQAHPAVRRHAVAAFSVPGDEGEQVVVVAERARQLAAGDLDVADVAAVVRASVSQRHGLALRDVVLIGPGGLPRTSSGKIQRSACRIRYVERSF
ncbi:fatty acyl-AMP ligase [Actinophytocola oryzae]|uniref:Acyl-CoA synthetase (AMP-forming)/AMP-acid ligase II n=1 Tax=Actinophytocola oryzae TaxID=502181 RepID=A0A4R7V0I6_9PSEU|nr:fatty acyl-AMP ligase [Actinophytocola oryzae]TDV41325.1 acyl-CoA synthetase (AMP-forming)/AMP-acid ligase II [Actinophytocola oryzae]